MIEFAVQLQGETKGRWVLAVDPVGERFLVIADDKSMKWVEMADCKFLKARNPDLPLPVVQVQTEQPSLTRAHILPGQPSNGRQ